MDVALRSDEERSGLVVECLTRDQGAAGLSLTGERHFILCLVLVQPRKTHPDIAKKSVDWDIKNQVKLAKLRSDQPEAVVTLIKDGGWK